MIPKKHLALVTNFWIMLVISLVLSALMAALTGAVFTPGLVLLRWAEAFFIVFIFDAAVPLGKWGRQFADRCGIKRSGPAYKPVSRLVPCFINVTLLTFCMTALGKGFPPDFLRIWLSAWPWAFAVCYILVTALSTPGEKLALRCVKDE